MSVLGLFRSVFQRARGLSQRGCVRCTTQQWRGFGQPAAQTHPHLVQHGEVTPGITREEYRIRRRSLIEQLARRALQNPQIKDHIIIIPSAARTYMTNDIPYPFRQNTDFLYFSGFLEPSSVLVLQGDITSFPNYTSVLFVPKKDPHKELWEGPRSGIDGAVELTGVDRAFNIDDLHSYLQNYKREHNQFVAWYDTKKPAHLEFHVKYIAGFLKENTNGLLESPRNLMQMQRLVKTDSEVKLMQKTCDIASQAFIEVMKSSRAEINEADLFAKMDYECRVRGADYLAYPPVVAGGNRANTIHYVSNNQLIHGDELVLMDAGCECHGYTSDITRTWPVSGQFSAIQRELYEALLEVQEACVAMCHPYDVTIEVIFLEMLTLLGRQLQRLGVVPMDRHGSQLQRLARDFCPHHVSHYLGMDVHDTDEMSRANPLKPGMCITIEPGLYIQRNRTDVPAEFRGLGIRIEDDILITETGPVNLTAGCPTHPDDIQAVIRGT